MRIPKVGTHKKFVAAKVSRFAAKTAKEVMPRSGTILRVKSIFNVNISDLKCASGDNDLIHTTYKRTVRFKTVSELVTTYLPVIKPEVNIIQLTFVTTVEKKKK